DIGHALFVQWDVCTMYSHNIEAVFKSVTLHHYIIKGAIFTSHSLPVLLSVIHLDEVVEVTVILVHEGIEGSYQWLHTTLCLVTLHNSLTKCFSVALSTAHVWWRTYDLVDSLTNIKCITPYKLR